jgi:hypothetical protein
MISLFQHAEIRLLLRRALGDRHRGRRARHPPRDRPPRAQSRSSASTPGPDPGQRPGSIQGVLATLEQYPRLRATRLWAMLRDRGYPGSAVQVRRYVRTVRPASRREAYFRLEALVDFQEDGTPPVQNHGTPGPGPSRDGVRVIAGPESRAGGMVVRPGRGRMQELSGGRRGSSRIGQGLRAS